MRNGILGVAVAAAAIVCGSIAGLAQTPAQTPPASPARPRPGAARPTAPATPAAPAPSAGPVQAVTSINRTAVWVGDPIVWTIELMCAPNYDVITDDLAGDKLQLTGLELVGTDNEEERRPDGSLTRRVRYQLRTYEVGAPVLQAVAMSVRYYERRPGQRAEDLTPAGKIAIPPAVLAWRSTIPEKAAALELREEHPAEPMPAPLLLAEPVGAGLILMSAAPVVLWAGSRVRSMRRNRERRPSHRVTRGETRKALGALRNADVASEADRREAYGQLSMALRRHVADTTGVPAHALTAEQVGVHLRQRKTKLQSEAVADVLAECDRARYGSPAVLPPSDRFLESVEAAERLI